MLLSIIVPTYNVEKFIANCLDSLLNQDIAKDAYEILVVNDGSTDNSQKIASAYAEKHENITLINQENKGLSGARNTGAARAKGKYTYFIDSDDYIAENTLGLTIQILETHDLDLLGLKEIHTKKLDLHTSSNSKPIQTDTIKVTDAITFIAEHNYLNNVWWYVIKTEFLKETGLIFPEGRLVEDANYTAKLLVKAKRVAYIPLDFYRYYMRPNSIMRKTNKSHVRRLIGDYQKNIIEFHDQLRDLKNTKHPRIKECVARLRARQESFVFFQLIKCIRFGVSKPEVENMISDFKKINTYPIHSFLKKDYSKTTYKILTPIINSEKILLRILKIRTFFNWSTEPSKAL